MAHSHIEPSSNFQRSQASTQPTPTASTDSLARTEAGESFLRLICSACTSRFVLDVEEWRAAPDESEVTGRDFLGIPTGDALCPHCLRGVQLAGAEHIYWRFAHA